MMTITLKIISYQRLTPGQRDSFQTDAARFSIGRGQDNDWVLPDPQRFMSGTHCYIENREGRWQIIDASTNGVFINGSDRRMAKNESQFLAQGDRIRLGDYELEVQLESATAGSHRSDETAPGDDSLRDVNTPMSQMDNGLLGDLPSIDEIFHLEEESEKEEPPPSLTERGEQGLGLRQSYTPPRAESSPAPPASDKYQLNLDSIPDEVTGLNKIPGTGAGDGSQAVSMPPPSVPPVKDEDSEPSAQPGTPKAPPVAAGSALAAFAAGAKLDPELLKIDDERTFFRELGVLLLTLTEGLMQAVASRSQIKGEFRLERTMIGPADNNPLKFSVSAGEALMRMLGPNDGAYLSGTDAAAEALDDINAHQLAVLAGTEAALRGVLHRLNPEALEHKFQSDSLLSRALPAARKARYWEFFRAVYDEILEAADEDFQQMFGSEFSDAYEKQLDRLKIARKDSK